MERLQDRARNAWKTFSEEESRKQAEQAERTKQANEKRVAERFTAVFGIAPERVENLTVFHDGLELVFGENGFWIHGTLNCGCKEKVAIYSLARLGQHLVEGFEHYCPREYEHDWSPPRETAEQRLAAAIREIVGTPYAE